MITIVIILTMVIMVLVMFIIFIEIIAMNIFFLTSYFFAYELTSFKSKGSAGPLSLFNTLTEYLQKRLSLTYTSSHMSSLNK